MHRFDFDSFSFTKKMKKRNLISSISIGVKDNDFKLIDRFYKNSIYPDYITIDIAHGHSILMEKMIKYIRNKIKNKSFLICGNVASPDGVCDLEKWGADAVKIGIGPGKVCTTKLKTGFGTSEWHLSSLKWCSRTARKPLIIDGGLRNSGDIAKSIRFGATLCMVGSMLAGHQESPGKIITIGKSKYKEYYGSSSEKNKKIIEFIEGKNELVKIKKNSLLKTLKYIEEDLQSAISYAGGTTLESLKKVDYIIINRNNHYY